MLARLATSSFAAAAVAALAVSGLAAPTAPVARAAQQQQKWGPGERMTEAVTRVMAGARGLTNASDYGYDKDICVLAAFLREKGKAEFNRSFTRGEKYALVGGGDNSAEDVDIEILDSKGKVVASDTKTDAIPVVTFTAPSTGTYTVRLTLYKGRPSFCAAVILRDGGYDIPVRNLSTALANLIVRCNAIDRATSDTVTFHDVANQWAMFGTVLSEDTDLKITNIDLGTGKRCVLAVGDGNARDLDLFLLDRDGDTVAKDIDPDAIPTIFYTARNFRSAGVKIKNESSNGKTLVLTAFLALN